MKKAIQMWSFRDRVHDGASLLEALGPTALCLLIALLAADGIAHLTGPEVPRGHLSPRPGET